MRGSTSRDWLRFRMLAGGSFHWTSGCVAGASRPRARLPVVFVLFVDVFELVEVRALDVADLVVVDDRLPRARRLRPRRRSMSGADGAFELLGDLVVEQRSVGLVRVVEAHGLDDEQLLAVRAQDHWPAITK